jgi:hypothetical protein
MTAPMGLGPYEVRLFRNNGFVRAATSPPFTVANVNPTPTISDLGPRAAAVGAAGFTVTVFGTGFVPGAAATVAGASRTTQLSAPTELLVTLETSDLAAVGDVGVQVVNPGPCAAGQCASNVFSLVVIPTPPAPVLTSISPSVVTSRRPGGILTLDGSDFAITSTVRIDGVFFRPVYESSTRLRVGLVDTLLANGGTRDVSVVTPGPGGGTSASLPLTVLGPSLVLDRASVDPTGMVTVTFSGGPGGPTEWVGMFPYGTTGTGGYVDWLWVAGGRGVPGVAVSGSLVFPSLGGPLPTGTFVFRWIGGGGVIAESAPLDVGAPGGGVVIGGASTPSVNTPPR